MATVAVVGRTQDPEEDVGGAQGIPAMNDSHVQKKPLRIMWPYAERPKHAFCVGCGCHTFLFFVFMLANQRAQKKFMNQGNGVALHLWENEWKLAGDAVVEGKAICTFDPFAGTVQKQQEETKIAAGEHNEYKLELVFEADAGNMMTPKNLKKVKELEDYVMAHKDYTKFCLREQGSEKCKAHSSALLACIPDMCGYYQNREGLGQQAGCGTKNAAGMTPAVAGNCDAQKSYHAGVYQCAKAGGCTRAEQTTSQDFIDKKLDQYSTSIFQVDFPETLFLAAVDASFGAGSKSAAAIRSVFDFGFPLEGYNSTSDRAEEQVDKVEAFMKDAYFDKLEGWAKDQDDDSVYLGYVGGDLMNLSRSALMSGDMAKIGLAFLVVGVYMVFMSRSYFQTAMALLQIFACFTSGFILYRILYGAFFGTFHVMALFLLLGVGVDDVFVMMDHFEAAALVDPSFKGNLWARISWTWKHATIAMGVTSGTTIIAFVMNATSSFPGIQAFGIFAGCLVFTLYVSMCFYYTAVVCFNHYMFGAKAFCCDIDGKLARITRRTSPEAEAEALLDQTAEKGKVVRFFENTFSYFILQHRIKILFVFFVASIVMFSQLPNIKADKNQPQMLPDDHPIEQYMRMMKTRFVRGGGQFNTRVHLVFGFDKSIIDRDGADPTGGGYGEDEIIGKLGKVKWNPTVGEPAMLKGLDCFNQLCDASEGADENRNTGGLPAYAIQGCWARDMKNHLKKSEPTTWSTTWAKITAGDAAGFEEVRKLREATDAANPNWLKTAGENMFAEKGDSAEAKWRFFMTDLKLTSDANLAHEEGNALADSWKTWLNAEMAKGSCAATADIFWPFLYAADFHQFKVVETMMSEMTISVITSICVAIVVLVLGTGNIFVGLAAGFAIGLIVVYVLCTTVLLGWELGMIENITLVMVPGLSVDYVAHLAEAYNQAKYDDREHRVIHALEHSGVSIISGACSTLLAALCLVTCKITFFVKFGTLLAFTIIFSLLFSLFFFPSLMAFIGPTGTQGDWHGLVAPCLRHEQTGHKPLRVRASTTQFDDVMEKKSSAYK